MDISSILIYKTKFSVSFSEEVDENYDDLLWRIVLKIKKWQTKKHSSLPKENLLWTKLKNNGNKIEGDGVSVQSDVFIADESELFWACRIVEKQSVEIGTAPRTWITEIGFEQTNKDSALFSCVVSYEDQAGFIGPYLDAPEPSVPNIVKNIIEDETLRTQIGSDMLSTSALKLNVGDWLSFREKIENQKRRIPYIYIAPQNNVIDPQKMAKAVCGNAVVYYSTDQAFTREVEYCNRGYLCYDGALMVYQPGEAEDDRHRFFMAAEIQNLGDEKIIDYLRKAFSQNIYYHDDYLRIKDVRIKRFRDTYQRHKEQITRAQEQMEQIKNVSKEQIDRAEKKANQSENDFWEIVSENDELKAENEDLNSKNIYLNSRIRILEENQNKDSIIRTELKEIPNDVEKIISYFEKAFPDRLLFADEVKENAKKECRLTADLTADKLWKVFYALATIAWDLYREKSGDIWSKLNNNVSGITFKRGEGRMTRNDSKLMRQFRKNINNEEINIEPHVTFPTAKQSIHFGFSEKTNKVIIGHCGEHFEIYSTQKKK